MPTIFPLENKEARVIFVILMLMPASRLSASRRGAGVVLAVRVETEY